MFDVNHHSYCNAKLVKKSIRCFAHITDYLIFFSVFKLNTLYCTN